MPSESVDTQEVSPAFLSGEGSFRDERQGGFWKKDAVHNFYGMKSDGTLSTVASSTLQKRTPMDSQMAKGFNYPDSYLNRDQKVNTSLQNLTLGSEKATSLSLPRAFEHSLGSASYFTEGDKVSFVGAPYENGLFSSSLSELLSRKLRLSSHNSPHGHSFGDGNPYEEEEPLGSLKELEAQTIGNLLPEDDDLFSGITNGVDSNACPMSGGDTEDLDLFYSGGGFDLGEDGSSSVQKNPGAFGGNSNNKLGGSNDTTSGELPSRTLLVRNISINLEDSDLQVIFEQYGDIRSLYTASKDRGFVIVSYYDIRAARNAMKGLHNKALMHRNLNIQYSIPEDNPSDKDINQGTLVVFFLDSSVPNAELRQLFGVYGEIKEIRETQHRGHHKFIEFYDVRAAEAALRALNRSEIAGNRIKVEPSRPGGAKWSTHPFSSELDQNGSGLYKQQSSPPANLTLGFSGLVSHGEITSKVDNGTVLGARFTSGIPMSTYMGNAFQHGISSSVPNNLSSLLRVESIGNQSNTGELSNSHGQLKFDLRGTPNFHPLSLPDCHDGLANGVLCKSPGSMAASMSVRSSEFLENPFGRISSNGHTIELNENVFNAPGNGSSPSLGHHHLWSNSHNPQPQGVMWPNSSSFVNGTSGARPQQLHAVPRAPTHLGNGLFTMNNHHVGSAPSVNPPLWERRHAYAGESPDASVFHPGSLGSMRVPGTSPHFMEFIPHSLFPHSVGSRMDLPIPSQNVQLHHNQRGLMIPTRGQMIPVMSSFGSPNERTRSRRHEGSSSQAESKKQFELDVDRILRGEDKRTTLMIKNIPNKYTSKMLLVAIDERHRGTYDFLYLPIDFKNKCNVGYAFINMIDPTSIVPFYQALNGKKWEKFNSEKVASLAYARIQGKAALISHFQNSSLMNEDKRCRPILFHTDGPNAGDQVPFPVGVNIRTRPGKNRSSTEENNQETPPNSGNEEEVSSN